MDQQDDWNQGFIAGVAASVPVGGVQEDDVFSFKVFTFSVVELDIITFQ